MEKLKVLGHDYDVIFAEGMADNSKIYGIHLPKTLKIFVDGSVPNSVTLETLWHEIHEALAYWNSIDLDHNALCAFAANSMAVLLNNPWLIALIGEYIAQGKIAPDVEKLDIEDYIIFQAYGEKQAEDETKRYEVVHEKECRCE